LGCLPENEPAHAALQCKLAGLARPPVAGAASATRAAEMSGKWYTFAGARQPWQAISFDFRGDRAMCIVRDHVGEHQVACGHAAWAKGITTWDLTRQPGAPRRGPQPQPVAASGAWIADDTYEMKLVFYTTPCCFTFTCRFTRGKLLVKARVNVSFGPTEFPQLTGKVVEAA
jgi:hypothetical protein